MAWGNGEVDVSDVRKRWYALHRARRVMLRDQKKHAAELMTFGSTIFYVTGEGPVAEYIKRAADLMVNPPYITDPEIFKDESCGLPRSRKLP